MNSEYKQLLEATLRHVEELKRKGVQYIPTSPDVLETLDQAPLKAPNVQAPQSPADSESPAVPSSQFSGQKITEQETDQRTSEPAPPSAMNGLADPEAKTSAMADLRERALVCQKCPNLVRSRKNVVFGVGDTSTSLMFAGEAPGADEDEKGEPFVGKAGQLLTRIIQTMGFTRQTVYIANVLKCRPDTPSQTSGNRKPTADEMNTCLPFLLAQIEIIRPKVIVALGGTAVEGLFGKTIGITKLRGNFQEFRGVPVMPTYHPSYLLRNQSLKVKREVWEDMLKVLELLEKPISEKQRNYFQKA